MTGNAKTEAMAVLFRQLLSLCLVLQPKPGQSETAILLQAAIHKNIQEFVREYS